MKFKNKSFLWLEEELKILHVVFLSFQSQYDKSVSHNP